MKMNELVEQDTEGKCRQVLKDFFRSSNWENKDVSIGNKVRVSELKEKIRDYARPHFDEREEFISCMNEFIETLVELGFMEFPAQGNPKLLCQTEKLYDSTEMKVKLLRYLQGDTGKSRQEIAEHFNISEQSLSARLNELHSPENRILGTEVSIDVQKRTNLYDSTVHPFFLALNLSEVNILLNTLIKAQKEAPAGILEPIIKDIVSQLTDYAKGRLKVLHKDLKEYGTSGIRKFRNEGETGNVVSALLTAVKCGESGQVTLEKDGKRVSENGKISYKFSHNSFYLLPDDGSVEIEFKPEEVKEILINSGGMKIRYQAELDGFPVQNPITSK